MMNKIYYAKFICPVCHKKFKQKICLTKNEEFVKILKDGIEFEKHVHCPRCEHYIPYKDKIK